MLDSDIKTLFFSKKQSISSAKNGASETPFVPRPLNTYTLL